MPKTLLLLRHAKSDWEDPELADHDRPLNKRGRRDAPRVGQLLVTTARLPQVIYCSTAQRARSTAELLIEAAQYTGPIDFRAQLYLAAPPAYIEVLSGTDDSCSTALAIGHNPGLEQLLTLLTGVSTSLPTAALAEIQLDVERWTDLRPLRCGKLIEIWRPKEHDD